MSLIATILQSASANPGSLAVAAQEPIKLQRIVLVDTSLATAAQKGIKAWRPKQVDASLISARLSSPST